MFKSLKRKGEKIKDKVDFKFGFQATKVPLSGWDKLWVSVIPIETGRVSAKTTRAIAKSGNCQWSDAVTESTKLSRDAKTDDYEEKLYKFVVSTGASRSGVLGEATLNVALYAKSGNPTQIALPLKNCSHGTILNVTITCLTPKTTPSRDVVSSPSTERNDGALDEDEALRITDDDLDDSDLSDNHTAGSITSNASSAAFNSATPTKALQGNNGSYNRTQRDGSGVRRLSNEGLFPGGSKGGSQNGSIRSVTSDVSISSSANSGSGMQDVGSTKVESGLGRQEKDWDRDRNPYRTSSTDSTNNVGSPFPASVRTASVPTSNGPSSSSIHKGVWQDPHGRPKDRGDRPISQRSRGNSENGSRVAARTSIGGIETLQADLAFAEATIEDLKQENGAVSRQKSKLTLEIDTLTQQLRARKREGEESRIEITALQAERDRLKQELEQFRSSKLALEEREDGEGKARWQTEDAQRALRELGEETKYQKEQNMHLSMQLSKTQDSNMELMLAIKDLEEALDQERKKTEEMTLPNSELGDHHPGEQNVASTQIEKELRVRVIELEQGKKSLEARILSLQNVRYSATSDDEHVTKLEKMTEQLTRDVEELEKESRELADENVELSLNVENLNKDVESKNARIAQLEQEVRKASGTRLDARAVSGKSSAEISSLRSQVKELQMKLSASEDAQSSHLKRNKGHVEEIQTLMEELRMANTRLENRLKSSEEEARFAITQLEEAKMELANVQIARDDFERQKKDIEDRYGVEKDALERNLAEAREAFAAQEREIRSLEETASRAEEERNIALGKITGLEDDISRIKAETRSIIEAKSSGEDLVGKLRLQKEEVEELKRNAESECKSLGQQLVERKAEITQIRQQMTVHVVQCKEFEARITQLEGQKSELESSIEDLRETEKISKLCIHELESRFSVVSDEMESVISSKKELEKCVSHSELQMKELQNQRNELEASLQSIEEDGKAGKEQVELLEAELRSLQSQMDTQTSSRRNLERRASELESTKDDLNNQLADMDEENLKHTERIADLEAQLRSATEETEKHKLERELLEARSLDHHNEKQKFETTLQVLGRDHRQKMSDFEAKVRNLEAERDRHENSKRELEILVQNLRRDVATSSDAVKAMEDRILNMETEKSGLEGRLLQITETHSVASETVASLEAEILVLRADNDKNAAALQVDLENLKQSTTEYEQRAKHTEELLRRVRWEKAAAVERLQMEVQRLTDQMTSTNDEREKLASQALVEASELRAEKGEWEERLRQAEQKIKEADAGCSSLKAEFASRLLDLTNQYEASKSREHDVAAKLSESRREIEGFRVKEETFRSQAEDLDRKLSVAVSERENLEGELDELKLSVQDSEMLGFEIQRMQSSLRQIKVERDSFDDSAKNLKVLNEFLEQEKARLEEDIIALERENEELREAKVAVEEKLRRLQLQLDSQESARSVEAEQRSESVKLRRQNTEFKRKLTEYEEEKEEFRRKVQSLEDELKERSEALGMVERRVKDHDENGKSISNASSSPTQDSRELNELLEKVKQLEVVVASKSEAFDNLKRDYSAKESILYKKIELLEGANEQLVQGGPDLGMDQLQLELTRLQNLNATLARRERELVSQLGMQEVLHKEVQRLQEENERMENRLVRFKETAKFGNIMEKVITLETELAEAMEANSMYKMQLRNAFSKQHNVQAAALHNYGDVDQIISDVVRLRKAASKAEEDVKDLRERYATMSVRYAEVSAQKEELVFTLRNLRNGKKSFNGRSDV